MRPGKFLFRTITAVTLLSGGCKSPEPAAFSEEQLDFLEGLEDDFDDLEAIPAAPESQPRPAPSLDSSTYHYIPQAQPSQIWVRSLKRHIEQFSRRWVSKAQLRVREDPRDGAKEIGVLKKGDPVWVLSLKEGWARLRTGGFVRADSLGQAPPDEEPLSDYSLNQPQ